MQIFKTVFNFLIVGLILMLVRSPIAMLIMGLIGGVVFYHNYPTKAQSMISHVSVYVGDVKTDFYNTPIIEFLPESEEQRDDGSVKQ